MLRSDDHMADVDIVVDVAGVLEQYNLCVRDIGGAPWKFRHEDFNNIDFTQHEKKIDWRKRVAYCLTPRNMVKYSRRRFYLSEWQLMRLEGFLRNPFGKLRQKMVTTNIHDDEYGGYRRMMVYDLTPYFEEDRLVSVKKIDALFDRWGIYSEKRY